MARRALVTANTEAFACDLALLIADMHTARLMGKEFDRSQLGLKRLAVQRAEGLVSISFATQPLDFTPVTLGLRASCAQYSWADAKVAHRQTYPIAANWKLAVENYVECYHCGPAHPEYSETHSLEQPPEAIAAMNDAMQRRSSGLGIEVISGDNWQTSATGAEAIDVFHYAL